MKSPRTLVSFSLLFLAANVFAADAQTSFEKLKSLEGSWAGKTSDGRSVEVSNRLVSNGSVIMSENLGEHMISMFHLDGDRLLLTHYCSSGNQPRMVATISPDGNTFTFEFLDATNLLSSQPGHMQRVIVTLLDDNHHREEWFFRMQDGQMKHESFDLQRQK
jgi:hypothetical protein